MSKSPCSDLKNGRHLQVALDLLDKGLALKIAEASGRLGAKIVEAGTPLIKMYGAEVIREIKEAAGGACVLADMKAADVGRVEVSMASKFGADIVTVLGCSSDETISEALEEAKKNNVLLEVDLINLKNPIKRLESLKKLGVEAFSFHIPIDVQKKKKKGAESLIRSLKTLRGEGLLISAAGGLNPERIKMFRDVPVNVFVVGGFITGSENFEERIKEVLKAIDELNNLNAGQS